MAIRQRTRSLTACGGLDNALQNLAPQPVVAHRAPTTSDTAPIGTLWVYVDSSLIYGLASISNGSANWILLESSGGAGVFSSLLVNPGPVTTQGTGAVNISADAVATTINIGTGAAVKTIDIGSTTVGSTLALQGAGAGLALGDTVTLLTSGNDGTLAINSAGNHFTIDSLGGILDINAFADAQVTNLGTGAAAQTVTVGSLTSTSSLALQSGTGSISLSSGATTPGLVSVAPNVQSVASPTATATANSRVIRAIFTGFTTAASASQAFTISSSLITTSSGILVTVTNLNASTNAALMQIQGITQASTSIVISTKNLGGGALGAGDNVIITVWILN